MKRTQQHISQVILLALLVLLPLLGQLNHSFADFHAKESIKEGYSQSVSTLNCELLHQLFWAKTPLINLFSYAVLLLFVYSLILFHERISTPQQVTYIDGRGPPKIDL